MDVPFGSTWAAKALAKSIVKCLKLSSWYRTGLLMLQGVLRLRELDERGTSLILYWLSVLLTVYLFTLLFGARRSLIMWQKKCRCMLQKCLYGWRRFRFCVLDLNEPDWLCAGCALLAKLLSSGKPFPPKGEDFGSRWNGLLRTSQCYLQSVKSHFYDFGVEVTVKAVLSN